MRVQAASWQIYLNSDLDEAIKRLRSGESPCCELAPDPLRGLLVEDEGSSVKEMKLVNWVGVKRAGKDKSAAEELTPLGNRHRQQPGWKPAHVSPIVSVKRYETCYIAWFLLLTPHPPPPYIHNELILLW